MTDESSANAAVVERFYSAFGRRDHATMAACYQPDARFSDPAFGELRGEEVTSMWRMLCERGRDLEIVFDRVEATDDRGSAHWEADYTFAATGRRVHNDITATFRFREGLIAEHDDRFSFWRWSRQALGPAGLALGWTPLLRGKVRGQARAQLRDFMTSG